MRDVLKLVGLSDFATSYPAQLSGGMRQRVCIARTLVMQPRLILLDEPFGALDQQTRLLMGDELLRLWRETGATVFLITHALDEATMLADRIGVMSARPGRLIDVVETRWPRERDSRIIEHAEFGAITARLWKTLREESMKTIGRGGDAEAAAHEPRRLVPRARRRRRHRAARSAVPRRRHRQDHDAGAAPDRARSLPDARLGPDERRDRARRWPTRCSRWCWRSASASSPARCCTASRALRDTLDPLFATYYAVPVFAFYPFFIVVFGLGDLPQVLIAFMLGVVAVIVNTLNGLDRVPRCCCKTARIMRLSPVDTALRVTLPVRRARTSLTGVKLAVAYAFIGVIGSEFIMSRGGIGYEISFAYTNFDNATMYPLIVLILLASVAHQRRALALGAAAARPAGHAMSAARWRGAAQRARADRRRCVAIWQGLYWWVGDVALALAAGDAALHGEARRQRILRHARLRHAARVRDRLRAVGRDRARWSASGSASTGSRATRSSR